MHPKDADQKRNISALHDTDSDLDVDLEAETAPDLEESLRNESTSKSASKSASTNSNSLLFADTIVNEEKSSLGEGRQFPPRLRRSRYEVLSLLGRGGMADVWLTRDRELGREVALKLIKPNHPVAVQVNLMSFEIEARVMSQLDHPGILPVFDLLDHGAIEDEVTGVARDTRGAISGYTMRVASYHSLADRIARRSVTPHELCEVMKRVALTTAHAHRRGVIHRDIKPHNILLGDEGEVYLTDWGVCYLLDHHPDAHLMTPEMRASIVGSPHFMSPEQSVPGASFDERVDVYGLGATLYFGLSGQTPVTGDSIAELLHAVQNTDVTPLQDLNIERLHHPIPVELSMICERALARSPDQRFESARAFADALERFLSGELDRERRSALCHAAIERGERETSEFMELFKRQTQLWGRVQELSRRDREGSTDEPTRQGRWRAEEELEEIKFGLESAFSHAVAAYREALQQDPHSAEAKRSLNQLFWTRYEEAERRGDRDWLIYFESQLLEVADEETLALLSAPSVISLSGQHQGSSLEVLNLQIKRYRTLQQVVYQGTPQLDQPLTLQRGVYLFKLTHPERAELRLPLVLSRAETRTIRMSAPRREAVPEGFNYIKDQWCMQTHPVTVSEYFDFLNSTLEAEGAERAASHAPRYYHTIYALPNDEGRYHAPFKDIEGDDWDPEWPVMLVSQEDAEAYCVWLSEKLGRRVRLPSAEEWLEAAQGPDQRPYPWGLAFDASLCSVRESQIGRALPTRVGSVESDRSVYGIYDVAGTIAQWTSSLCEGTESSHRVMGAAFNSMPLLSELTQEQRAIASECFIHLGFRVLLELTSEDF